MSNTNVHSSAPELIVKSGNDERAVEMRDGKLLFAGRTTECDLCLPSPAVSRKHAVFMARNGECGIKDLDSANGTFLNGKKITRSMRLKNGDIIQIASFFIEFRNETSGTGGVFNNAMTAPPAPAGQAAKPPDKSLANVAFVDDKPMAVAEPEKSVSAEHAASGFESGTPASRTDGMAGMAADAATAAMADETPRVEESFSETGDEPPAAAGGPAQKAIADFLPAPPKIPERMAISDDEVGDGADDASFLMEETDGDDDGEEKKQAALSKAAAEAGLVGEFTPDVEDENGAGNGNERPGGVNVSSAGPAAESSEYVPNPDAVPINERFRQAVETRLFLYSFLADMQREREEFIARRPKMADPVKAELARQDRELEKIPTPEQCDNMIEKRRAKQKDLMEKIKAAKAKGEAGPPKPSRDMREAEEMAISQWTFCAQSAREALPAVFKEGYKLMADEPLAPCLKAVRLDPVKLMGGGAYYLALEVLQEETKARRAAVRVKMSNLPEPGDKNAAKGGKGGMFGMFGKGGAEEEEEEGAAADDAVPVESYEELAEEDKQLGNRTAWINQEIAFMEKALIAEFWRLYIEAALVFLPRHEEMPVGVRAFLRHGAVGFKKWWMKDEVRAHIMEDCMRDVVHHLQISKGATNVVYADEYLAAVMNWECTPAMDENLEINERNSPNWKADKALRKLINSRSQTTLMEELIGTLSERTAKLQGESDALDERIAKLLPGSKNFKQAKNELSQQRQTFKVEITKLTNLANKIRNETLSVLKEAIDETKERFDSGELPKPTTEFIIRRECEAVHKIGRLLANLKERFMPLVLRDNFVVDTDAVNDRPSILGEFAEFERRDPSLFLENIVPSKKKANRVDLRISPVIVLVPAAGMLAFSWNPRQKPEDGRLGVPTCFIRRRIRERQLTYLLSDFRWDTSKAAAGMDVMTSETIVAAFMTVRWDWRKRSKEGREKGLVFNEQNDRTNWRRVYETYMQSAFDSGKKLFNRNYDFYERVIGKYFDLPEDVELLRK